MGVHDSPPVVGYGAHSLDRAECPLVKADRFRCSLTGNRPANDDVGGKAARRALLRHVVQPSLLSQENRVEAYIALDESAKASH